MKKLKPSLRPKEYYLVIEKNKKKENIKDIKNMEKAILDYIGVLGYAKANPQFIEETKDKIIISVERKAVKDVRAALLLAGFSCSGVSGILKKARKKFC